MGQRMTLGWEVGKAGVGAGDRWRGGRGVLGATAAAISRGSRSWGGGGETVRGSAENQI